MTQKCPFWKPLFALTLLGLIGVISLLFVTLPQLDQIIAAQPALGDLPTPLLILILLLQPFILLVLANIVGCLTAPRVGLVSFIYDKVAFNTAILTRLKPQFLLSMILGLIFAVVVMVLDMAFLPFLGEEFRAIEVQDIKLLPQLAMGMLYGGITEELLLRWGFMSLLVWIGWRLGGRRYDNSPSTTVMWMAIFLSAILFGIGHLPAMASMVTLNTIIIIRTILLNAIGGIVFGWLFWRKSLEAAMVAHAFGHVGFFVMRLVF